MSSPVLPNRIFAAGEEPSGERVNSYHRAKRTEAIIAALDAEELAFLKNSTFAKVISLDENPPFSGAFGHFILVRRLKTNKKYEIWFLFAGYPIRFSLREFAIVTGLNCGKLPATTRRKRKNPLNEKLYWNELFGSLKSCSIEMVIDMLKTRKVKDKDMRIKYALLAITSSVLLPSSHCPKIIPEHVELIRDLDKFMAYPWGRVSFQLLMSSLMKKDEMALAQDSFALRGYVDAIQLVMIASVPALKEEVVPNQPKLLEESESETEETFGDDPESVVETGAGDKPVAPPRFQLNPKNARDLNAECKIPVRSILDDPHEEWEKEHDFAWPDEKIDEIVDTLVKLVSECFKFKNEMFLGGLTFADIERLRGGKQTVSTDEESPAPSANISIANLVAAQITSEIGGLESRIVKAIELEVAETIRVSGLASKVSSLESAVSSLQGIDGRLNMTITSSLKAIEETVMKAVSESYNKMLSIVLGGQQNTFVVPGGVQNPESHHPAPSKPTNNIGGADHAYTTDGAADAVRKVIADLDEVTAAAEGLGIEPNPQLQHNESASQGDINQSTSSVDPLINITEHQDVEESDSEELPSSDNLVPSAVECPSFSIGLTQDGTSDNVVDAQPIEFVLPQELEAAIPAETRKSKRPKTVPAAYTDFKCDPKIVVQYSLLPELDTLFADVEQRVMAMGTVNLSEHISVSATEFLDIAFRRQHMPTKVMDALMGYLSSQLKSGDNKVLICDTTLPAKLMRMHSRFVKTSVKERPKLKLFDEVFSTPTASTVEKIYFPFNIDQTHWVAVCVDRKNSSIHVLDCNVLLKTDSMMKKELNPIANMFPYVGNNSPSDSSNATYKPFSVSRSKGIPQYGTPNDSAVMAVLLIDSHSSAGLDGCKAVTQRLLPGAAKQLAVKFFDFISGTD